VGAVKPESFKGAMHFIEGGIAFAIALYNLQRFTETKSRRNLINVVAFGLLVGLEAVNTRHHWSKLDAS